MNNIDPVETISSTLKTFLKTDYTKASLTPMLGGNSNTQLFLVNTEKKTYVLRITDPAFSAGKVERTQKLMKYAASEGFGPQLYHIDPNGSSVIMEFIPGKKCSDFEGRNDPLWFKKLAQVIRKLHSGPRVDAAPTTFENIQERIGQIKSLKAVTPSAFTQWIQTLETIEKAISKHSVQRVACHGDLNPANILIRNAVSQSQNFDADLDQKIYLIDWDRSGLGDPFRDLATIAVFLNFSEAQSKQFLMDYTDGAYDAEDYAHFYLLRHCHLMLGAFWAFQHPFATGLAAGSPVLSKVEMDQKLESSNEPTFDQRDPRFTPRSAVDFQHLGLSCVKQFMAYTSSFDFRLHLDVLNAAKHKSIFLEKSSDSQAELKK